MTLGRLSSAGSGGDLYRLLESSDDSQRVIKPTLRADDLQYKISEVEKLQRTAKEYGASLLCKHGCWSLE